MGTLKVFINIDHVEHDRWEPPLVDAYWHAFCQATCKRTEKGSMGRAVLSLQRNEQGNRSQKSQGFWAMKTAKDRSEVFYDPARKEDILERTKTRLVLWEEHLKEPIILRLAIGSKRLV